MNSDSAFLSPNNLVSCTKIGSVTKSSTNSPKIIFEVKHFSIQAKKDSSNIFIHNSDTMRNIQLTRNDFGFRSSDPVLISDFLPIGTVEDQLFYLKDGNIWGMLLSGGEPYLVCKQAVPIESFKVFQGEENRIFLLLVMEVYASLSPAATAQQDSLNATSGTSGMVFDRLMVRHWDKWGAHSKRNHLFICPLDICEQGLLRTSHVKHTSQTEACNDEMVDLMFGMETDCPGKGPGLGGEEYSVSSDGQHIAFASRRTVNGTAQPADMAWTTDIGENWRGSNNCPTFSPDCRKLAFLSCQRAGYESDRAQIRIFDVASSELYSLTTSIDLSFASIEWDIPREEESVADSSSHTEPREYTVYATAPYRASVRIFRLHFSGYSDSLHFMEVMDGDESRSSPVVLPLPPAFRNNAHFYGGRATSLLYYLESSLLSPLELKRAVLAPQDAALFVPFVAVPLAAGSPPLRSNPSAYVQEIYSPNPQYTNGDLALPECTQHYFKNSEGELVHCWYMHPVIPSSGSSQVVAAEGSAVDQEEEDSRPVWGSGSDSDVMQIGDLKDGSVPLLVVIHGGPQSSLLNNWNYRWNLATLASQGYGVLAVNFHGSTGFGTPFCDSIRNDWGGKPFDDIMRGTDFVLQKFPYLDASRTAALGPSYGGYMINWINGHTDRFKCLVNHDGVFSLRSQYFSNDELWFPEWEFGVPWERPEEYLKWSPDTYVAQWKTPTLVIHGGRDYRVCETEGIATFTALQRRGVPSQMLYFPDENHWTLKPINSLKWHTTVFEWLRRWLQVDSSSSSEEDLVEEINE